MAAMSEDTSDRGQPLDVLKALLPRTTILVEQSRTAGEGGQLYISLDGTVLVDFAWGKSHQGQDMAVGTLVPWASAVKPTTCAAVMRLWEEGQLEVDDPVAKYIPEFAANGKEAVTIRHLLTHTGHLGGYQGPENVTTWEETIGKIVQAPREGGTLERYLRRRAGLEGPSILSTPPPLGTTPSYDPAGIWILGEIVSRLHGQPFSKVIRAEVFEPCGMDNSWNGIPPEQYHAYAQHIGDTAPRPSGVSIADERMVARAQPAGGGIGPSRELGRFYEMMLGRGQIGGRRVLLPQTVEAMTGRHTVDDIWSWGFGFLLNFPSPGQAARLISDLTQQQGTSESFARNFGLSVRYGTHASPRTFGHVGSGGTLAFADPEYRLVVAGRSILMIRFGGQLAEAVYEDLGLAQKSSVAG